MTLQLFEMKNAIKAQNIELINNLIRLLTSGSDHLVHTSITVQ